MHMYPGGYRLRFENSDSSNGAYVLCGARNYCIRFHARTIRSLALIDMGRVGTDWGDCYPNTILRVDDTPITSRKRDIDVLPPPCYSYTRVLKASPFTTHKLYVLYRLANKVKPGATFSGITKYPRSSSPGCRSKKRAPCCSSPQSCW